MKCPSCKLEAGTYEEAMEGKYKEFFYYMKGPFNIGWEDGGGYIEAPLYVCPTCGTVFINTDVLES